MDTGFPESTAISWFSEPVTVEVVLLWTVSWVTGEAWATGEAAAGATGAGAGVGAGFEPRLA